MEKEKEKIKTKIIKIIKRSNFIQMRISYDGEEYEGILLSSGKQNNNN
jgi:hypothetical protein